MPEDMPDVQLLRDRDREAWDALYQECCRHTYRVLYRVTGAKQSVLEELNQEVWLSAIESVGQYAETRGTAQDWVLGIARFKGLSYLRKQYGHRVAFVGGNLEPPQPLTAREELLEAAERSALLQASIESLPENWRYVLQQKYQAGMSVHQISELTQTTPKAVESLLSRARQRLRDLFQETLERKSDS
jgi:RNA polymerase sigma-70 factor (ECF subfamily)